MLRISENIDWQATGERIRAARLEKNLTQKDVADPVVSPSLLSLIESGMRHPSPRVLEHIAERLEVEVEELLLGYSPTVPAGLELQIQEARNLLNTGEGEPRDLLMAVRKEALRLDLKETAARCLEVLGSLELKTGAIEDAMGLFREAEELWSGAPIYQWFETVVGIARCLQAQGNPRRAIHELESYLLSLERQEMAQPTALLRVNSALVAVYSELGMSDLAAEAAERALALTPRIDDPAQIACMNMNVAKSLLDQGRTTDALHMIREAEQLFLTAGWQRDAARAKLNRGIVELDGGHLDNAEDNLQQALSLAKEFDEKQVVGSALNELGRLCRVRGDIDMALDRLLEARSHLDGNVGELALNSQEMGLCIWTSDGDQAKEHFRVAIDLLRGANLKQRVASTYAFLGDLQTELGEIAAGADSYKAGITAVTSAATSPA
jgi:tetratricopeptide (TPR) repeat protein